MAGHGAQSIGQHAPLFGATAGKRAEIYTYESSNLVYGLNWSVSGCYHLHVELCFAWIILTLTICSAAIASMVTTSPFRHSQNRQEHRFRLAVGSFIEEYQNRIEIITCELLCGSCGAQSLITLQQRPTFASHGQHRGIMVQASLTLSKSPELWRTDACSG